MAGHAHCCLWQKCAWACSLTKDPAYLLHLFLQGMVLGRVWERPRKCGLLLILLLYFNFAEIGEAHVNRQVKENYA